MAADQPNAAGRRPRDSAAKPIPPTGPAGQGDQAGGSGQGGRAEPPAGVDPALQGPELARAVLDAAKARRAEQRKSGRSAGGDPSRRYRKRGYSGPGPDPRDPQPFGKLLEKLIKDRGWQAPAAEATVFGDWEKVVGSDIAAHCRPVRLADDGELTIEAESTAWATQLRLLSGRIMGKIASEVRPNPVKKLRVHGPAAPSWRHGRLRVRGPGPGDTYG